MLRDCVKDAFKTPRGLHHEIHLAQVPASQKKVSFQRNTDVLPLICGAVCGSSVFDGDQLKLIHAVPGCLELAF